MNLRNKKLNLSLDLDILLLVVAFIYLGCVLLWLFRQDRLKLPFTAQPPQTPATTKKSPAVNPEFIDYLRRSFNRLEREKTAAVPSASAGLKARTAVIPRSLSPVPQSPPTVVERIYVPIYPPTQSPPVQSIPSKVSATPTKVTLPPPPAVASSSVPVLSPVPKAFPSPMLGYTLVGLLESGEVGYALFKINGTAQRFEKGNPIGGSGWILAAVRNQTAIISRNGQQRAIEVGQSF